MALFVVVIGRTFPMSHKHQALLQTKKNYMYTLITL